MTSSSVRGIYTELEGKSFQECSLLVNGSSGWKNFLLLPFSFLFVQWIGWDLLLTRMLMLLVHFSFVSKG